ncbi:MAG: amino acid adenylation domain-containing protein [Azospirillaceae bacterium]|nr:amino acid adenylation domain-containing protein [Azospirillaceae bacterium]
MPIASSLQIPRRHSLTSAQLDIWVEQKLHPQSTQFMIFLHYALPLALDVDRFIAATDWVFRHDDVLYAHLSPGADGTPELVFDPARAPRCHYLDFTGVADPQQALEQWMHEQAGTPLPMLDAWLAWPVLIKLGDNRFCYCCRHHHLVVDGWGSGIVFRRIAQAYDALGTGLEPRIDGISFVDYLDEGQRSLDPPGLEKALAFWKPLLAVPAIDLTPVHAGAPGVNERAASRLEITLPRALADRVSRVASSASATLFHAILLAHGYLLARQYGLDSCPMTLPILNRVEKYKETIGLFAEVRTIPLPLDSQASATGNLLAMARRIRELFRHYRIPAADLARLNPIPGGAAPSRSLGAVSYITRDFSASIDGVSIPMWSRMPTHEKYPFNLYIFDIAAGQDIRIVLGYHDQSFNPDEAALHMSRLLHLLEQFSTNPETSLGDLDLVPPAERRRIEACLHNDREPVAVPPPIIETILNQARLTPDAIAVETLDTRHSYRDCVAKANALARALVLRHGVVPGDGVALLLPRGADLVAGYLAIMMTGAAFIPIEPYGPEDRARRICVNAEAKCLISHAALETRARAIHPAILLTDEVVPSDRPFTSRAEPEQTAYIIYTSGSTGQPKGVEISHAALSAHLAAWFRTVPLGTACERVLHFFTPAFDAGHEIVFPALMRGNTLIMAPHPPWPVQELPAILVNQAVTYLYLPPAYLLELLKTLDEAPERIAGHRVRLGIAAGDVMHGETAALWPRVFGTNALLFNNYGPTEITVAATMFQVPANFRPDVGESVPIGRPHQGRLLRVVDDGGHDVPIGTEGELLISGIGLAKGYRGMPRETAERFVVLEDGRRYYRSGDIVRLRSDGNLVFRRRRDRQLKIQGYRIEPGEIEACLLANKAVKDCAVLAWANPGTGETTLRAFIALFADAAPDADTLRAYLQARLPSYMIPVLTIVDHLPRNLAGKLDREALPALARAPLTASPAASARAPQEPVEEYLVALWQEVLGASVDDTRTDFFALGGHSLLAARLIAKISKAFRVDYPFASFFANPTVAATASQLEQLVGSRARLEKMARLRLELSRLSADEIHSRLGVLDEART